MCMTKFILTWSATTTSLKMRNLIVSVVLLICFMGYGYSYQCYKCTMASNDKYCLETTNCSAAEPYCETSIVYTGILTMISKYCSAACISTNQSVVIASHKQTCCARDFCNDEKIGDVNMFDFSSANGLTGSIAILVPVMVILSALLPARV